MSFSYLFDPNKQFQDRNGVNNVGGFLRVYIDGTDDRATTYKDFNGTLNEADIMLDTDGRAVVIVDDNLTFRIEVYERDGALQWTVTQFTARGEGGGGGSSTPVVVDGTANEIDVTESMTAGVKYYTIGLATVVKNTLLGLLASLSKLVGILNSKADKVQGATAGNIASLDANGNITDSGSKVADFKTKQTPVSDPSASGNGLDFIDSVSQNANGEITPHKKSVQDGSTSQKGVVQLQDSVGSTESETGKAVTPHAVREAINAAVSSAYHAAGTKSVAQLTSSLLVAENEGCVYNITDSGTTTSDFVDGAGYPINAGDNVGVCDVGGGVYKFDLLSGFVDLTNYLTKTGDGKDVTSTLTKASGDTSGMTSGSKLSALFTAISSFFATIASHISNTSNPHSVTKAQVGLGNVDNTSDANKPVSTAQQTALNAKQDTISDLATIRSGATAGASALQPSGNGSNLSVTPDGTSTGYDIGSSTTLMAFAQKFKNLVSALKALAFKDKVSDSDINGTISNSHIASASTWNGKQDSLGISSSGDADKYLNQKGSFTMPTYLNTQRISNSTDADTLTSSLTSRIIEEEATSTNHLPDNSSWWHLLSIQGNDNKYATQIALGMTTTSVQYRRKDNNVWSSWSNLRHASWINSGTFGTDRIADDAITAAKVKDNETLPVNISGSASKLSYVASQNEASTWRQIAKLESSDTNRVLVQGFVVAVRERINDSDYYTGTYIVSCTSKGSDCKILQGIRRANGYEMEFVVAVDSDSITLYAKSSSYSPYHVTALFGNPTIAIGSAIGSKPAGTDVAKTFLLDAFGQVGSTTTPVYVDSNGQVKPCDPSQMSVGNATKWDGHAISIGTVSSSAGTISIV